MTAQRLGRVEEHNHPMSVWLGELAALEESLTHLRRRRADADSQLTYPDALDNITG